MWKTLKVKVASFPHWIIYLFILFVIALFIAYFIYNGVIDIKAIGTAFLAMIGTFAGALFAFRLNEKKDNIQLDKERRASLYRAQLIVMRQYNAINSISKLLSKYRTEFDQAFNCPAFLPPSYSDLTHNFDELVFLLEHDPTIVMRLTVTQEGFHQAIESLRLRNEFYVNKIQPAIAAGGLNKRTLQIQEFRNALGELLFETANSYARNVFEHVTEFEKESLEVHNELYATAKKLYPNSSFVKLAHQG